MDFYDVIKKRRSIRSYKSDPVPEKALKRIAEAVHLAPSACNMQPWKNQNCNQPGITRENSRQLHSTLGWLTPRQ